MHAEMDAMQMTCDADHDFASMMIIHFHGGIDMATTCLKRAMTKQLEQWLLSAWLIANRDMQNVD